MKKIQKRVEYQKYIRVKLEHERHRKLFGLTDNIVLVGEEDLVLQREFRIDFVLQKIDDTIRIIGIFDYFREYNLLEFKSINDRLDMILVDKYIGQLFWWLHAKRGDAKKGIGSYIRNDEVTLTIITVGNPRSVIKELKPNFSLRKKSLIKRNNWKLAKKVSIQLPMVYTSGKLWACWLD